MPTYCPSFDDFSLQSCIKYFGTSLILAVSLSLPFQHCAYAQNTHNFRKNHSRTVAKTQKNPGNFTLFQKGMASWYSVTRRSRHLKTAQGKYFNPESLTAAHPFLPFGTKLLIRSQRTGKSVIVKVNDRGPYSKNRIIDLSRSAAERIGLIHSGIGAVTVSVLNNNNNNLTNNNLAADEVAQMPIKSASKL